MTHPIPTTEDILSSYVRDYDGGYVMGSGTVQFYTWLNRVRADVIRDVATGFIDWDIMYGFDTADSAYEDAMKTVEYLERMADEIEAGQ